MFSPPLASRPSRFFLAPSSKGTGERPFKPSMRVRISLGSPLQEDAVRKILHTVVVGICVAVSCSVSLLEILGGLTLLAIIAVPVGIVMVGDLCIKIADAGNVPEGWRAFRKEFP